MWRLVNELVEDGEAEVAAVFPIGIGQIQLMLNARQRDERTVIPNYVEEVVPHYNYREFLVHFRLQRTLVEDLAHRYGQSEFFVTLEGHGGTLPLNPWKQTLVFLWFVGHQTSSYRDVADRFGVGLNTLFRIISRFSSFLGTLGPVIIHLPSEDEKRQCKEWYQHNKGFPDIIGSLDGTHIRIDKPTTDPDSYINRKGYHSIQLQGLVNEKGKFMDVFVGYPGSVHDARVLRMSSLFEKLPRLCRGGGYIVGDSAYPCLQTLLVPYRDNGILTGAQRNFNRRLSSCCVTVEHAFGLLKQRFRQLYHLKLRKYERMLRVIYACCVLHNIADEADLDVLEPPPQDAEPAEGNVLAAEDAAELINFQENGRNLRDEVCRQLAMVN